MNSCCPSLLSESYDKRLDLLALQNEVREFLNHDNDVRKLCAFF